MIGLMAALMVGGAVAASGYPNTPLFAGFDKATFEEGQQLLQARVGARYRIGQPEGDIEQYLRSQGMKTTRETNVGDDGQSVYGEGRTNIGISVCDRQAIVTWRANKTGTLTELLMVYGDTGCL